MRRQVKNLSHHVKEAVRSLDNLIDGERDVLGRTLAQVKRVLADLASADPNVSVLKWKAVKGRKERPTLYGVTEHGTYSVVKSKDGYYCRFYLGEFPGRLGRFDKSGPPRIGVGTAGRRGLYKAAIEAVRAAEKHYLLADVDLGEYHRRRQKR